MLITLSDNTEIIIALSAIDNAIANWLADKATRSNSVRTARAYKDAVTDFRIWLHRAGLDLDSDPIQVSQAARTFAASRKSGTGEVVSASTFNQKLAILSSFYSYVIRQSTTTITNPIARLTRGSTQDYRHATPLDTSTVNHGLQAIDRTSIEGRRDYALLSIALSTGRRVAELAALRRADLHINAEQLVTVTFRHCKGDKTMYDTLSRSVSGALIDYLYIAYGADFSNRPADAPIWSSLSDRNKGRAIGVQTIADICERRLGTSKVHTLRHTYARQLERSGAPVSQIQAKLGHASLDTTGRYLAALKRADNPYSEDVALAFGIK